jgi:hypothetical protein
MPSYDLHIATECLSCRRSAVDEFVNPNLQNDFAYDFGIVGLGLKFAKAFRGFHLKVLARRVV